MNQTEILVDLEHKFDNLLIPNLSKLIYEKYVNDLDELIKIINSEIEVQLLIDYIIETCINLNRVEVINKIDDYFRSNNII